jgi:uncharacterized protein with HEPN domain
VDLQIIWQIIKSDMPEFKIFRAYLQIKGDINDTP